MSNIITGTIESIGLAKDVGKQKSFMVRDALISVEGKYPQLIPVQITGRATEVNVKRGDTVRADFDLRGNEHNGRHYVKVNVWRIEVTGMGSTRTLSGGALAAGGGDDVPF